MDLLGSKLIQTFLQKFSDEMILFCVFPFLFVKIEPLKTWYNITNKISLIYLYVMIFGFFDCIIYYSSIYTYITCIVHDLDTLKVA